MKAWRLLAGLCGLSLALLSCQVILGLDEPVGTLPPVEDAAPGLPPDLCQHATVPGRSDASSSNVDISPTYGLWFATREYEIPYSGDGGLGRGLDLDGRCTCNPNPQLRDSYDGSAACVTSSGLSAETCDEDGGVDDAFGKTLDRYFRALPALDPRSDGNKDILVGFRTGMVWLNRWNGTPDDDDIDVAFVASSGLRTTDGCDGGPPRSGADASLYDGVLYYPPRFDGCDRWTVQQVDTAPTPFNGPPTPIPTSVGTAFVSGGLLVAEVREAKIGLIGVAGVARGGHVVARITPSADGGAPYAIDGFLAGRFEFSEMVKAVQGLPIEVDGGFLALCTLPQYAALRSILCSNLDVRGDVTEDTTPGLACNAASAVIGFHAVSARVDGLRIDIDSGVLPCPPDTLTCP